MTFSSIVENKYCTEKDDRLSHQESKFFMASKEVVLTLHIWPSRKASKRFITEYILNFRFVES